MPRPKSSALRKLQRTQKKEHKKQIKIAEARVKAAEKALKKELLQRKQRKQGILALDNTVPRLLSAIPTAKKKLSLLHSRGHRSYYPRGVLSRQQFENFFNNFFLILYPYPKAVNYAHKVSRDRKLQKYNLSYELLHKRFPNLMKRLEWSALEMQKGDAGTFGKYPPKKVFDDFYKIYLFLKSNGFSNKECFS